VALALREVERRLVPDLPDRIITATALHLGLPLISRDRQIQLPAWRRSGKRERCPLPSGAVTASRPHHPEHRTARYPHGRPERSDPPMASLRVAHRSVCDALCRELPVRVAS